MEYRTEWTLSLNISSPPRLRSGEESTQFTSLQSSQSTSNIDQYNVLIATAENFEIIIVTCGGKPDRGIIGLKVYHSQINDAFCFELYKTLGQKTKPLGMIVIGRNSPRNKYLGSRVGCLPVHCSQFINRYGIPPLPENDKSSMLNLSILLSSPGTLQEAAKKFRHINLIRIDNVQVMNAKTSAFSNIMEINGLKRLLNHLSFIKAVADKAEAFFSRFN
ncbi:hypothetical protein HMPREF1544_00413 [Mucor circinelloides 1006PhL]|uniref:Uncharacterized protein n=1 Tax=Mucor circinelloides f. circinelloides (strain 1006PhL) TaxID=1220926 RepID=S2JRQ4_MUCC1|nr:hypothetical protein HMPREF1544_00413 [Mucor circinelloides 1006PhL]